MAAFHGRRHRELGVVLSLTLLTQILTMVSRSHAQGPPSPGYYPSSKVGSIWFNQYFASYWGSQHQSLSNQGALTIWLDHTTGPRTLFTFLYCQYIISPFYNLEKNYWMLLCYG
ncbi:unnamed protein product [Cuscuta campestris]|uniref:GH16 domain-containing protein n=1 Tax=Cuscuta campestris TaxID=132261 RepID=A0A484KKZ7_9ASTE|nr:unnamed protein product [Cuscuta campestris]